MHMTIGAIVYAHDKKEAKAYAEEIFGMLTENQTPFDYFSLIDWDENKAGSGIAEADSKLGKQIIKEMMNWTQSTFLRNAAELRKRFETMSDEELYLECHGKEGMPARFFAHQMGMYRGSAIHLYDADGEGIQQPEHLENVLEKWPGNVGSREELEQAGDAWVVIADVPY